MPISNCSTSHKINAPTSETTRHPAFGPASCFSLVAFAVWWLIRSDYGTSWDEAPNAAFGEAVLRYFRNGFDYSSLAAFPVANLKWYAPTFDLLTAALASLFDGNVFVWRHSIAGIFWVATFWPVCRCAVRLGGTVAGWFAGCALLGLPVYLGHAFINGKDLPLACATAWFLLACGWAASRERPDWRTLLALGGSYGFVLATRPGAWFFGVLLFVPQAGCLLRHFQRSDGRARLGRESLGWSAAVIGAIIIGALLMIAPWPYAHQNPWLHPLEAMRYAARFDEVYPVLFAGETLPSNRLPWHYYLTHFGLQTPLPVLAAFLLGHFVLLPSFRGPEGARSTAAGCLFLFWVPMLCFVALRPNVYDGIRHFLFLLPILSIVAGTGASLVARRLPAVWGLPVQLGLTALLLLSALPAMATLHPYQYAYYNLLAGPRRTLHERFETDYWVTSYREAAHWIAAQPNGPKAKVAVAASSFSLPAFSIYAPPTASVRSLTGDFVNEAFPPETDYYVGTVRYGQWRNFGSSPVVHVIQRDGILMSVIRGR